MSAIFDGVATALGSVGLNSVANYLQGNQNVKNTNAINANQMQLNKQFQEWQYLNQPQLQVQGMKAAGMNPAMQGAVTNASSSSNGSVGSMNMNPNSGVSQDSLSNSQLVRSTQELNAANAEEARTRSGLNQANTKFIDVQTNYKQFELDYLLPLEEEFKKLTNAKTEQETNLIKKNIDLVGAQYKETLQKIQNLKAEKKLTEKQADYVVQQIQESLTKQKLMRSEMAVNASVVRLNNANASVANKLGYVYEEQAKQYKASTENIKQDTANKRKEWLIHHNEAALKGEMAKQAKIQTKILVAKGVNYGVAKDIVNDVMDIQSKQTEAIKNIGLGVGGATVGYKNMKSMSPSSSPTIQAPPPMIYY